MLQSCYGTERLLLRLSRPELAAGVAEYYRRNRDFLRALEPERDEAFFTEAHQREELAAFQENQRNGREARFWIEKKSEPLHVIGSVALNNIMMGPFCSCFLAYKLDAQELRQGYAAEAVRRVVELAFDELGLHRIEANIMPRNTASLKLAEKLGFHSEGISPRYLRMNGVWEDHVHMVLLNDEIG